MHILDILDISVATGPVGIAIGFIAGIAVAIIFALGWSALGIGFLLESRQRLKSSRDVSELQNQLSLIENSLKRGYFNRELIGYFRWLTKETNSFVEEKRYKVGVLADWRIEWCSALTHYHRDLGIEVRSAHHPISYLTTYFSDICLFVAYTEFESRKTSAIRISNGRIASDRGV